MHHRPEPDSDPVAAAAYPGAGRRAAPELGTLRDFWSLLVRRWTVVAAVFILTTASVVVGSMLVPPTWTASSTIMVKQGREFFYRAEVGDANARPLLSVAEMVNSQVEILGSRDLAEQVIWELGVYRVYPDMPDLLDMAADTESGPPDTAALLPEAAVRFQESLTVMDVPESGIIRIGYENRDPQVAADAVNLLVEKFKAKHIEVFSEPAVGLMAQQRVEYERRLVESEKALERFRQEHAVYELAEQRTLLLKRGMELESELQAAGLRVAELEQTLSFLNAGSISAELRDPPPPLTEDRASLVARRGELGSVLQQAEMRLAELRQLLVDLGPGGDEAGAYSAAEQWRSLDEAVLRLLDLQLREKEALRNYSETSRMVTGIREQIAMVEAFLRDRGAYVRQVAEAAIHGEMETLQARRNAALLQIEALDAQILAVDVRVALDELAPLETRSALLGEELARSNKELQGLDKLEMELRGLTRQVALDESNYQGFLGKSEDARLLEELDRRKMVNIAVIERAARPVEPSSLSTKMRAVIGAAVGLLAGMAAAVFLELVSRS